MMKMIRWGLLLIIAFVVSVLTMQVAYGQRVTDGLISMYDFTQGNGPTVFDRVGSLNLTIDNPTDVNWILDGGIVLSLPNRIESDVVATDMIAQCVASNEISIEMWMMPLDQLATGPARMISLSVDGTANGGNFMMGQTAEGMEVRLRTSESDKYGNPALTVLGPILDFTKVQHIVFTRDNIGNTLLYIDGVGRASSFIGGDFSTWVDATFTIGNESIDDRPWAGSTHLTSVYSKALTFEEVQSNFDAGYLIDTGPPITGDYNPLYPARVLWDAPTNGVRPSKYIVSLSLNGGPWFPYATTDSLVFKVNVQLTFWDNHRAKIAGINGDDITGPYSTPSDVYNSSLIYPHPATQPIRTQ